MRHLRLILAAGAALLVLAAVACGGDDDGGGGDTGAASGGDFPAVSGGNVIPEEAVADINKGADPPFLYTQNFGLENCTWDPRGYNPVHGSLEAGAYTVSVLEGKVGEIAQKPIAYQKDYLVLPETKKLNLEGIGPIEAAIVQEREYENGKQIQLSFNWYSMCKETGTVFSLGEDSFALNPETGEVTDTEGSWFSGYINTLGEVSIPSIAMPANPFLGARYIFDGAPGIAFGGTEIVGLLNIKNGRFSIVSTPLTAEYGYPGGVAADSLTDVFIPALESAGEVRGCIQIEEISQDSGTRRPDLVDITAKVWCPGYGLVYDTSDGALTESKVLSGSELEQSIQTIEDNQVRAISQ